MSVEPQGLDFAGTLRAQRSFDAAWLVFNDHLRAHGVSHALYAQLPSVRVRSISREMIYHATYPEGFTRRYASEGMIDHDPRAHYCESDAEAPLYWNRPGDTLAADPEARDVLGLCEDFGLAFGMTLPLKGRSRLNRSGMGLAFDARTLAQAEEILAASEGAILSAAALFHALAQTPDIAADMIRLSLRERECLLWSAAGLRNKEIAFRLSIAEKTVEHHMASAMTKLHAVNRTHAVARALILGLIAP
ncbi:LuxR family transcriptional regulator [Rhodovulum sp. BSW8]|uniref:Autoinducer binding domain-containing protein n=2 Tax=Rhodovulum visakhapatnamense TaxID=364297 RepID=A0A4R8FGX7_9RHOB|nr:MULTISPECIES: LuxR family transcriptional regulator [Rhodovulum]MBL3576713.1 autoinducer binding domain-containing protein [Rhodovulum visakhapatnamense]OLS44275.1 hypothetical protein BV509_07935 [Rhodovulum sulfidophilum]RBO54345.1 LuxR family transcriptional regulator [Rhodovulum sp. BSW8]TDX22875.1 LuxR family transcriptional regulator [Rhodovulum visakhapatnamense]